MSLEIVVFWKTVEEKLIIGEHIRNLLDHTEELFKELPEFARYLEVVSAKQSARSEDLTYSKNLNPPQMSADNLGSDWMHTSTIYLFSNLGISLVQ